MTAIESQLIKARGVWGRIGKVIKKKSFSNPRVMSIFYKVIVQTVLLYGAETWVLSTHAKNKINSFHHRCLRYITGKHITKEGDTWIYPSMASTLSAADLLRVEEYIENRKTTISVYAEQSDIFHKCLQMEGLSRNGNTSTWWTNRITKSNEAEISYTESDQVQLVLKS